MKAIAIFLFLISTLNFYGQEKFDEATILRAGEKLRNEKIAAFMKIQGEIQYKKVALTQLIKYGLQLYLTDTTYKIIGFIALYDCHSRALFDVNDRAYLGSCTKPGDTFIKNIWVGDMLVISCINVEKHGKHYRLGELCFTVE